MMDKNIVCNTFKRYSNPITGIYKIQYEKYIYIGSAAICQKRKAEHFWNLSKSIHSNPILQNIYNKHNNLEFSIIEMCSLDDLLTREQHWIDAYKQLKEYIVINILPVAGSTLGYTQKPETCAKKSISMMGKNVGKKHTPKQNLEKSIRQKGRPNTWGEKISKTTKGRPSHKHQTIRFVLRDGIKYSFLEFSKIINRNVDVIYWAFYYSPNPEKFQKKYNCKFITDLTFSQKKKVK